MNTNNQNNQNNQNNRDNQDNRLTILRALLIGLITSLVIAFSDIAVSILFTPRFPSLIYMTTPLAITFIFVFLMLAAALLLVLVAHADMRGTKTFKMTEGIIDDANLKGRKARYRALEKLERYGAISVIRHRGRKFHLI